MRKTAPRGLAALAFALVSLVAYPFLMAAPAGAVDPPLTAADFVSSPVSVGGQHTCLLPGDGTVRCWGGNDFGQLGNGRVTDPGAPAGDVLVVDTVIANKAAFGTGPDCLEYAEGAVLVCTSKAPLAGVTAIAAGFSHTCALLVDATVECWGSNVPIDGGTFSPSLSGGELGDGTLVARPYPAPVIAGQGQTAPLAGVKALSAAAGYTCALLIDTSARCWGNAPQAHSTAPIAVLGSGGQPLTGIAQLATGDKNACALLLDGSVVCWGRGYLGSNGPAQSTDFAPEHVVTAGAARPELGGIKALALGGNVFIGPNGFGQGHSCALAAADGGVLCWGSNEVSELGDGHNQLTDADPSRDFAAPVISAPGSTASLTGAVAIAAGGYFTCAVTGDSRLLCWGLGYGGNSFEGAGAPVPVTLDPSLLLARAPAGATVLAADDPIPVALAAGGDGLCAVTADGSVWCLGFFGATGMAPVPGVSISAPAAPTASPTPPSLNPAELVGDWKVTYGSPTTLTVTYADGTYTMTAAEPVQVTGASCSLPAGTRIATFSVDATGQLVGQHGLWLTSTCAFQRWAPMNLTLDASRQTLTGKLGDGEGVVFVRAAPPVTPTPAPTAPSPVTSADIDGLEGTWTVTYGGPATVKVSFSGGLYTVTTTATTRIAGSECSVPAGTIMETFSGSGGSYSGQQALFTPTCGFGAWVPLTASRDGTGAITLVYDGKPGVHVLVPASGPSIFRNSIPLPWEINLSPAVVLPTLLAGLGLVVLVPFPGALFNSTLSANYAELMRRIRRGRRRLRNLIFSPWFAVRARFALGVGPQPVALGEEAPILAPPPATEQRHDFWWTLPGVGVFVVATAVLSGYLDPGFGLNQKSIATFVGMLAGLVLVLVAFELPSVLLYRRRAIRFWPRALPATIFVSLACLLLSRLTDFHPGYLYGLIITISVATNLDHKDEGRLLALGTIVTIGVAVAAWLALGVVAPAAATSADPVLIGAQTVLSMTVADGIQVAAFGMLPLSVLAGAAVRRWNPKVHAALWLFGIFAFGIVILNPQNGYLSDTTRTPLLTIVALLAVFAIGSIWFWNYFRRWHVRMTKLAASPVAVDDGST